MMNRKSRGLGWETADLVGKGIAGSGDRKSRGLGWEMLTPGRETAGSDQKRDAMLEKITFFNPDFSFGFYKRERET